jgi:hypothetical protein
VAEGGDEGVVLGAGAEGEQPAGGLSEVVATQVEGGLGADEAELGGVVGRRAPGVVLHLVRPRKVTTRPAALPSPPEM